MERTGGVLVYDVTDPNAPEFVDINIPRDTADGSGDQAPEGLIFISKTASPTNFPLVVAANETSSTITIWEIRDSITSINKIESNNDPLLVYPNPAEEKVFITAENGTILSVQLMDMTGKIIQHIPVEKQVQMLNVENLKPNIYLLKVETEKGMSTTKLIVH